MYFLWDLFQRALYNLYNFLYSFQLRLFWIYFVVLGSYHLAVLWPSLCTDKILTKDYQLKQRSVLESVFQLSSISKRFKKKNSSLSRKFKLPKSLTTLRTLKCFTVELKINTQGKFELPWDFLWQIDLKRYWFSLFQNFHKHLRNQQLFLGFIFSKVVKLRQELDKVPFSCLIYIYL